MYSPQFPEQHQQQQATYYYGNMAYQPQQHSMVDARRMSYTDYLSGQSEGSASDYEQSTPSPLNVYEDYNMMKEKYQCMQQQPYLEQNNFSSFPPLYPHDSTAFVLPAPQSQNVFYYPTPLLDINTFEYPSTNVFDAFSKFKSEEKYTATPTLEKDEQDSFHSSRSSSPDMSKSAVVPLKSSCRRKVTKPRSKRAGSVCSEVMDIKSFRCEYDQCEKVFKRSEHLKRHIRSIHTKEKRKFITGLFFFIYRC
jgi:hypothetical protein